MKKITIIEIIVVIIVLCALTMYLIPNIIADREAKTLAIVKSNNAIYTSKVIEEFSHDKSAKPSDIAKKVADELNKTQKNPYDNDKDFFSLDNELASCSNIEADDNLKMIIVTTLDRQGELISRTVINPPSFVTYYKENEN